jgi:hypothetical protein
VPFRIYKQALHAAIDKLDVVGLFINHLQGLQQIDYNYMAFCLTNHVTDMHEIRMLLHKRLLAIGRENYRWLVTKGPYHKYPDRAPSAVALAYAIEHGELTEAEAAGIVFDHGDTSESFMADERKKFLDTIIQQIISGMNNQKGSP